jgi:pimeloyl-ACP methyl ester carboxylesterase/DNA-binding CsgD family transcriptional regulator
MKQQIRFCVTTDGVRIAYALCGSGAPLVICGTWLSHLEHQWRNLSWQPWLDWLAGERTLLRYDMRGCGLSDRNVPQVSFADWVSDFEAVVEAAGFERFPVLGICQGGPIAVEYAARHPERVSRLVLYGTFARGRLRREAPQEAAKAKAWLDLVDLGWGEDNHAFLQMYATSFQPGGTLEHLRSWGELQRASTSATNAAEFMRVTFNLDVRDATARVQSPTLVANPTRSVVVPLEEARLLATLIPGARFLPLESENLMPLPEEPAWAQLRREVEEFLAPDELCPGTASLQALLAALTEREAEILDRIAQGLDNARIAAHLDLSEKTVRNHITRIFDKLGVESRSQAIVRAREAGLGVTRQFLPHAKPAAPARREALKNGARK